MILRHARANQRGGLSLLEVLLALTILVLAIAAIGRLVDVGTDRGNDARAYNRGSQLAQSKMAEVEAGVVSLSGSTSGQFTNDDSVWSYSVSSQSAGPPNLYTVTVTVTRDIQGRSIQVSLTQMLYDPTMMGSASQAESTPANSDTDSGTGSSTGGSSP